MDAPGPAGLNLTAAMNPRELGRSVFSGSVLRGHGLIIEDPLVMAADPYIGSPPNTRGLARRFIEAAVASLTQIDVLIDHGIVQTFFLAPGNGSTEADMVVALASSEVDIGQLWDAFEVEYIDGLSPSLRVPWQEIRAGNRNPRPSLVDEALTETDAVIVSTFVDVVASLRSRAVIENTVAIVASALDDVARLGARHDLLCGSPLFARLLFLGTSDPVAELCVGRLAHTPVRSIRTLDVSDVVSMRQTTDAFERWR